MAGRKTPIRTIFGFFLLLIAVFIFWMQVNLVENFENNDRKANSIHAPHQQPRPPKMPLKRTSVDKKKPPPPVYSNESFKDCKILRPNDIVYQYGPWDGAPIVIESHKLVFFSIPKVGSTVWKQLFRRMEGYMDYLVDQHPLPHAPKRNGLQYLYDYPPLQADFMLTDPTYTRAIFLRDPKERLLSAYLDKGRQNSYLHFHCCHDNSNPDLYEKLDCAHPREHHGPAASLVDAETPLLSFADFVSLLLPSCEDPHWNLQADRMDPKYWKYINFVGYMESIEGDTRRLLNHIGAWEEYGESGWPNGHVFAGSATISHKTGSSNLLKEYFAPTIEQLTKPFLQRDYDLPFWNATTA